VKDTTFSYLLERGVTSKLLTAVPIILLLVVTSLLVNRSSLNAERDNLSSRNAELEASLTSVQSRLIAAEHLVGKDEGLVFIRFDELIPIEIDHIRAISLNRPTYANQPVRIQLVLENRETSDWMPRASVELLGNTGAKISHENLYTGDANPLAPGETRTIMVSLNRLDVDKATYLKVYPL